mgnify:CR=1 FL=1
MEVVDTFPSNNLNDIPERLRALATGIEDGVFGEVSTLLVIMPKDNDWPAVFGYGINAEPAQFVFQMELAKVWFANNLTVRRST